MATDDDDDVVKQVQRTVSLSTLQQQQHGRGLHVEDIASPVRRRGLSRARHQAVPTTSGRRRRKVTFKNMYAPEIVPPPKVESYDELVFNVAGLFHTTSFLHEPEDWGEEEEEDQAAAAEEEEDPAMERLSSKDDYYDPEPPLERSIPLMIAEFLHRSAMFLGQPQGDTPWLPGFRQDKKFSSNDVKRWRRLAHFDWEAEERAFLRNHAPRLARTQSVESNGHTSVMSTIGASFRLQHQLDSVESASSSRSHDSQGKMKFKSVVTGWLRKHTWPHHPHQQNYSSHDAAAQETTEVEPVEEKHRPRKRKPVSWLNPPPLASSRGLQLLVDIINSCVYCGHFQFRKRDIVRLCNVKI